MEICLLVTFSMFEVIQVTVEGNKKQTWKAIKLVAVNKITELKSAKVTMTIALIKHPMMEMKIITVGDTIVDNGMDINRPIM